MLYLSKFPNKHSRLYLRAQPFPDGRVVDTSKGEVSAHQELEQWARSLAKRSTRGTRPRPARCGALGPPAPTPSSQVTKGVQYLNEIKDSKVAGFQWATEEGALREETAGGVRFDVQMRRCARTPCSASPLLALPPRRG